MKMKIENLNENENVNEEEKVFCYECRDDVSYNLQSINLIGKLKGIKYEYVGKVAYCDECGLEVYIPDVEDFNLKALYDVYREANDIISLEKIKEIPSKYDIGKRPLSLLLNWGENTFSRFVNGDMPSKQYSDVLKKIYESPEYFKEILETGKSNLKSELSYERSIKKVNSLLNSKVLQSSKIDEVIEYILYKCEDTTHLALQKILYYVQGFNYAFYEKFCFEDECEAWVHGPVFRNVYSKYSSSGYDSIESPKELCFITLTSIEVAILDSVIKNFACYSGKTLESFTHSEEPWIVTRGDLPMGMPSDKVIEKELIAKYFKEVKNKYEMLKPSDIKKYSSSLFDEI